MFSSPDNSKWIPYNPTIEEAYYYQYQLPEQNSLYNFTTTTNNNNNINEYSMNSEERHFVPHYDSYENEFSLIEDENAPSKRLVQDPRCQFHQHVTRAFLYESLFSA